MSSFKAEAKRQRRQIKDTECYDDKGKLNAPAKQGKGHYQDSVQTTGIIKSPSSFSSSPSPPAAAFFAVQTLQDTSCWAVEPLSSFSPQSYQVSYGLVFLVLVFSTAHQPFNQP